MSRKPYTHLEKDRFGWPIISPDMVNEFNQWQGLTEGQKKAFLLSDSSNGAELGQVYKRHHVSMEVARNFFVSLAEAYATYTGKSKEECIIEVYKFEPHFPIPQDVSRFYPSNDPQPKIFNSLQPHNKFMDMTQTHPAQARSATTRYQSRTNFCPGLSPSIAASPHKSFGLSPRADAQATQLNRVGHTSQEQNTERREQVEEILNRGNLP